MAHATDVAAAILNRLGTTSTMKLQKLLYFCQGWHLAWEGEPLFDDEMQAWANGPVVRSVYRNHRGSFSLSPPWPHGDEGELAPNEVETIDVVLETYGGWSARELVLATHRQRPWIEARGGLPDGSRSDATFNLNVMLDFFGGQLDDA